MKKSLLRRQPDDAAVLARSSGFDLAGFLKSAYPILLVIGVWMVCNPYEGITHDSRLYVAQALHSLQPEVFGNDIFFAFGSQDDFTAFSVLFAPLVDRFGPAAAAMIVVAVGHAIWLSGAAALALKLAPTRAAAVAGLVLVAVVPGYYGAWRIFTYGEGFATPRLLVEGLGLWAIWALTSRRLPAAAVLVLVGATLHPLVAATVLCVGFFDFALRDRRWLLVGLAGLAAVVAASFAGIPPFDRLLRTMDPEWLEVVALREPYLFPTLWTVSDWGNLVLAFAAILSGAAVLSGWRRRLLIAVTLAGLCGLLVAYLGADVWNNLLAIQIQPWRTLWVLHVFAFLAMGTVFAQLWRSAPDGLALIAAIVFSWLLGMVLPVAGAALGILAYGVAVMRLKGALRPLPSPARTLCITVAVMLIAFLTLARASYVRDRFAALLGEGSLWDVLGPVNVIEVSAIAAVALCVWRFLPGIGRTVLPATLVALIVGAVVVWDSERREMRAVATAYPVEPLDSMLPANAQVYWEGDVDVPWLALRRPSYVSIAQGAGIEFNRRTALTYRERTRVVQPLTGKELVDMAHSIETAPPPLPALTHDMLLEACRSDDAPDVMILSRAVQGAYASEWILPAPILEWEAVLKGVSRPPVRRAYLYRCADLL